ncbi:hypothetical protein CEXT_607131 [Caerostris extrusa]|uniref:Uncharacterized protein n=1 Tax=Caerostris extrusa TaxID=172846 RepID=A0AAV4NIY4_CAEEX|nr:hypothetical protein CEXT_607131 [Caerostris extrusa]
MPFILCSFLSQHTRASSIHKANSKPLLHRKNSATCDTNPADEILFNSSRLEKSTLFRDPPPSNPLFLGGGRRDGLSSANLFSSSGSVIQILFEALFVLFFSFPEWNWKKKYRLPLHIPERCRSGKEFHFPSLLGIK